MNLSGLGAVYGGYQDAEKMRLVIQEMQRQQDAQKSQEAAQQALGQFLGSGQGFPGMMPQGQPSLQPPMPGQASMPARPPMPQPQPQAAPQALPAMLPGTNVPVPTPMQKPVPGSPSGPGPDVAPQGGPAPDLAPDQGAPPDNGGLPAPPVIQDPMALFHVAGQISNAIQQEYSKQNNGKQLAPDILVEATKQAIGLMTGVSEAQKPGLEAAVNAYGHVLSATTAREDTKARVAGEAQNNADRIAAGRENRSDQDTTRMAIAGMQQAGATHRQDMRDTAISERVQRVQDRIDARIKTIQDNLNKRAGLNNEGAATRGVYRDQARIIQTNLSKALDRLNPSLGGSGDPAAIQKVQDDADAAMDALEARMTATGNKPPPLLAAPKGKTSPQGAQGGDPAGLR